MKINLATSVGVSNVNTTSIGNVIELSCQSECQIVLGLLSNVLAITSPLVVFSVDADALIILLSILPFSSLLQVILIFILGLVIAH